MVRKLLLITWLFGQLLVLTPAYAAGISAAQIFALTNDVRTEKGLPQLTESPELTEASQLKAMDMANHDYFDHYGPDGATPWGFMAKANYQEQRGGENLAIGFSDSQDVVNAWLASPSHRENLLDYQFEDMGITVLPIYTNGVPNFLVVQMFGALQKTLNQEMTTMVNGLLGVNDVLKA
ncbi:CAP domain-containing protein [Candidatus Berkelbacteria bacterium]|nr:CAP domain-containing protein [Candidatus Berkelbacteria bacterium]